MTRKPFLTLALVSANIALAILVIALFLPGGCQSPPSNLATTKMQIGRKTFTLEIAATNAAREYGLMQRDSMPSNHGMIFVFRDDQDQSFWMKNTRIPLDIIYINSMGQVVSIHQMKPYDLTGVFSDAPAKYAIELNEGMAESAGVKKGDVLKIPPEASSTNE